MIFEEYVKENRAEFVEKVKRICGLLKIRDKDLMLTMYFETAGTFSPSIKNPNSSATGLIQFMSSTAKALGTTTADLAKMSNVQQLDYVYRYLKPYSGRMVDWLDVYLAVFYPAAMGKPDSYRITCDKIARDNPVFDLNKDLDIEKSEIRTTLLKKVPAQYKQYFR